MDERCLFLILLHTKMISEIDDLLGGCHKLVQQHLIHMNEAIQLCIESDGEFYRQ